MQKYRYVTCTVASFLFFLLYWCLVEIDVIIVAKKNVARNYTSQEVLYKIFMHQGSYIDTIAIILFVFVFCICLNYILVPMTPVILIRMHSRYSYIISCLKNILLWSFIYSVIYTTVNIIMVCIFFDHETVSSLRFSVNSLISCINLILFFFCMGSLLMIINIIVNKKYSSIIIFIYNLFGYALLRLHIFKSIFIMKASLFRKLITQNVTGKSLIYIFATYLFIIALLTSVFGYLFLNKDIIKNEYK